VYLLFLFLFFVDFLRSTVLYYTTKPGFSKGWVGEFGWI